MTVRPSHGPFLVAALVLLPPVASSSFHVQRILQEATRSSYSARAAGSAGGAALPKVADGGQQGTSSRQQGKILSKSRAASKSGQLKVTSNPAGATINLDGQTDRAWVTPYTFTISAGSHTVTVSKDLYATWEGHSEVLAGKLSSLQVELDRVSEVYLETNPPDAEVLIDGRSYGLSPVRATLKPGLHTYEIRFAGMPAFQKSFILEGGMRVTKRVMLGPMAARPGLQPRQPVTAAGVMGYIVRVRGDVITINLGFKQGLHTGSALSVFKASSPNAQIGKIQVIQVLGPEESQARIVTMKAGIEPALSDVVRPE